MKKKMIIYGNDIDKDLNLTVELSILNLKRSIPDWQYCKTVPK